MVCSDRAGTKTALGIIQFWFTYFVASFLKHFSRGLRKEMPWQILHSFLFPFLCMRMITPVYQFPVPSQNTRPLNIHEEAPMNPNYKVLNISSRTSSQPAASPALSVLTARKTSTAVISFSSPKRTSCLSDGVIVSRFKISLEYSLQQPRMPSLLSNQHFCL